MLTAVLNQNFLAQRKSVSREIPDVTRGDAVITNSEKLSPEKAKRLETFRLVWQTVSDNYFDRSFGGISWNKIKDEFEPRALQAASDAELHAVLQEMINRLKKSHLVIIPPEVFREINSVKAAIEKKNKLDEAEQNELTAEQNLLGKTVKRVYYGIGIDIRWLENQVVVTAVEKDSPAEKSGLKTGYALEKINGVALKSLIETFNKNGAYAKALEKQISALLLSWINGETGSAVSIGFLDENEKSRTVVIKPEILKGESVKILPNLPEQLVTFEADSLSEEIGYIRFNAFALSNVEKFCGAIGRFKNSKALVIDLRGNFGGNFGALYGIASLLTDRGFLMGTQISKSGRELRFVPAQLKNFKGKIVVLTDEQSFSAAEVLAAGLKETGRATIVGETTAGAALPALTMNLPTGAVFLYPIANFETPRGNPLEGLGVEPNIKIPRDRKSLLEGRDVQFEAAIKFLKDEITKMPEEFKSVDSYKTIVSPAASGKSFENDEPQVINVSGAKSLKIHDERALKVIDEYIEAVGGRNLFNNLTSLTAIGTAELKQAGAIVTGAVEIYRKSPNKISKIIKIEAVGEINEVFDGRESFVQTDFMGIQKSDVRLNEINLASNFRELLDAREVYPTITFETAFEKNGQKINLIKAVSARGDEIYFAFDDSTKLLISRAGKSVSSRYGDYRKVGDWLFPFEIAEGSITYKLTEIKPNAPIDDKRFVPKESCFTKID